MLRQKPVCNCYQSYVRQINAVHVATNQPTPLWPSHRPFLLKTLAKTPLKNPRRLRHRSCLSPRLSKVAKPLTRTLRERRKSINVWINSKTRVEKTLAPPLPLALTVGLRKICSRSHTSTVTKKGTIQRTALSPKKTYQKTSIGLGDLRFNN